MTQKVLGKLFRSGLSLDALIQMFQDSATAVALFEKQLWGAVGLPSRCLLCNGDNIRHVQANQYRAGA